MSYALAPCSVKAALKQVRAWHRKLPKLQGALFAARVIGPDGECCAVGLFGNPCQEWQDTGRGVITRIAAQEGLPKVGEHAAVRAALSYQLGTGDLCPGGVNPPWDECQKCGATSDDECRYAAP